MKHQLITSVWINGLLTELSKLRINLHDLEASLPDLDVKKVRQGQRVSTLLLRQIWHRASELSQDPLLGFRIGRRVDTKGLGALAPVLMHSPTPRISIKNVATYYSLISDSGYAHISTDENDYFGFHYTPRESEVRESPHQVLSLLTSMIYMGQVMHIETSPIARVCLPEELDLELISQKLKTNIQASNNTFSLWFRPHDLDTPIAGTDSHFYQMTKGYADELLSRKSEGNDLVSSIRTLITNNGYMSTPVDIAAENLGMNRRSLQRFLAEEKTSFRLLKEEIVKEKSLSLIIRGELSFDEISQELGYSEVSAFHRAFKKWFDVTPQSFKKNRSLQLTYRP